MRNWNIQFGLLVAAVLCFGNANPLLAGTITQATVGVSEVAPGSTAAVATLGERPQLAFVQRAISTHKPSCVAEARSLMSVPHTRSNVTFLGLHGDRGAIPQSPPQRMPDGHGTGGMGVVPTSNYREPAVALFAFSCNATQEVTEILGFQSVRVESDPGSAGLYRPPRCR